MIHCKFARIALAALSALVLSAPAQAQLFRAYLAPAPAGSDMNPCTLPAPCRLLPVALAAVADGGEIWMLDSANYNNAPVDITKSVTILAVPGALGSVVATGGNAINIATAGVEVVLRNLVIVPVPGGGGTNGIFMTAGAGLTVENCVIANLQESGIAVLANAFVRVTDSTLRDSRFGLRLENGPRATVTRAMISGNSDANVIVVGSVDGITTTADIADSTMDGSTSFGVSVVSTVANAVLKVSVKDSRLVRNSTGVRVQSNVAAAVTVSASNNIISNNITGIASFSTGSRVSASGNTISDNVTGLQNSFGGLIETAGNNTVIHNGTAVTGALTPVATM